MDQVNKIKKLLRIPVRVSDQADGDDEPDDFGYRPVGHPSRIQVQGTVEEVEQVAVEFVRRHSSGEEDEVLGDGDTVLGVRGQRRNRSSWATGKDRRR